MSLASALEREATYARKGPPCSVGTFLATLDDEDRSALEDALARSKDEIAHVTISRAIRAEFDHRIAQGTIGRHRAGECLCRA